MVRSGEFIQFILFLGAISVAVSIIIMLWPPPRSKRIKRRTDEPPTTGDRSHPAQKLHPQDQLIHHESRIFSWATTVILLVFVGGAIFYYIWQKQTYSHISHSPISHSHISYSHVYKQLGIAPLSALVENQPRIQSRLEQLSREPCYQEAIIGLSDALLVAGYPRESAVSLLSFAKNCGGPSRDVLERAYHSLKKVNDFSAALSVAEDLVASDPANASFRNYRAEAYEHLKDFRQALDDYINVVQLLGEPRHVAGNPFYQISRMYAALGRHCDAITPIETYVSFDPVKRQSTQTATLIAEYANRGSCQTDYAKGATRVRLLGSTGVHTLSVVVNGVAGNFILDTGATYVAVTSDFAKNAKVTVEGATVISLKTVGGVVSAYLSHNNKVTVGSADAQGVPVAVIRGAVNPFGGRLDGLLGMSFLARFKVTLSQSVLELKAISLR